MKIEYIKNKDIDYKKWDLCIQKAINGNIYAYSWYLDIVCKNWDALIYKDYEAVMPITFSSKLGINYMLQPLFSQQLGVFSSKIISKKNILEFINAIPTKYKYVNINFNKYNKLDSEELKIKKNNNYELDLIPSYNNMQNKFSLNTVRNINKSKKSELTMVLNSCSVSTFVKFIKENAGEKVNNLTIQNFDIIKKIVSTALLKKCGTIFCVYNKLNELVSAAFFVFSHNKAIYLFASSTKEGKNLRAMFFLINEFIIKYSEKNLILYFEGSNIDGLSRFYKGFGAINCEYVNFKYNRLPFPLKFLKK